MSAWHGNRAQEHIADCSITLDNSIPCLRAAPSLQKVHRLENVVGWYHSHPGYGCWLSGIDCSTQMLNQQFQASAVLCMDEWGLLPCQLP